MVRGALGPGVEGGMGRGVGCGLEAAIGRWLRWAGTPSAYLQAYCIRPWDENGRLGTWDEVDRRGIGQTHSIPAPVEDGWG